jgi:hypothetical protein
VSTLSYQNDVLAFPDGRAVVAAALNTINFYDLGSPYTNINTITLSSSGSNFYNVGALEYVGNFLYAGVSVYNSVTPSDSEVYIYLYDVSSLTSPVLITQVNVISGNFSQFMELKWINGWLYFNVTPYNTTITQTYVMNSSCQGTPTLILTSSSSSNQIEKRGNYLYIANEASTNTSSVYLTPNYYNVVLNGGNNSGFTGLTFITNVVVNGPINYMGQYICDEYVFVVGVDSSDNINIESHLINRPSEYMNDLEINGTVNVNGEAYKVTSPSWIVPSDERLKKNIVELDKIKSLEKLLSLNLSEWQWSDGRDEKIHRGPIAQDLQKVYPEYVKNFGSFLAIDTGELLFEALAIIKILKEKIEELEKNL